MPALAHTPYADGRKPFTIGLQKLDPALWIEPDERRERDLAQKDVLFREAFDVVFREEPSSRAAQAEALHMLAAHLVEHFPETYQRREGGLTVGPDRWVPLDDRDVPPLQTAARLVQDDLLLLHKEEAGWRLVAAALCFPSSWSLAEKFGQTLDGLHEAVPGYRERLALRMARIFDNLQVGIPAWRLNWSIYPDDELHHPSSKQKPRRWFDDGQAEAFVRVERQVLTRLPETRAILFSVKVLVDPMDAIRRHPERVELASGLRDQILALDVDQLAYKGMTEHAAKIAAHLDAMASDEAAAPRVSLPDERPGSPTSSTT